MIHEKKKPTFASYAAPSVLFLLTVMYLAARFRAGSAFLAFFEDDFFYYLTVAKNIAAGRGSSFDGIHPTNGYHPLWLLLNVLFAHLFAGQSYFYVLIGVMAASVMATYFLLARSFSVYLAAGNAAACAFLVAAEFALIMSGGMEIVLSIPLIAWLCSYRLRNFRWSLGHGIVYGLLASGIILARLDAILFVGTLAWLDLFLSTGEPWVRRFRAAAGFFLGLLPVALYLLINQYLFHTATPISGSAKQLRTTHVPDLLAFRIAFRGSWPPVVMLTRPVLLCTLLAVILVTLKGRGGLQAQHRALVWALLLFPLLQLGLLSLLSDWPIWEWYFYPFVAAAIGVVLVFSAREELWLLPLRRLAGPAAFLGAFCLLGKAAVHDLRAATMPRHSRYDFYYAAGDLARFARTHPGNYAMGDRAGLAGYEMDQPVIQLEGLMMDKPFLENIRHRRNLLEVLKAYNIRYYIATDLGSTPLLSKDGCFDLREPMQAGPTSPVMQATLCQEPVYILDYNHIKTYIFDMQHSAAVNGGS